MTRGKADTNQPTIDPDLIARVVREVVARLTAASNSETKTNTKTNTTAVSIDDRVITASTIDQITGSPQQVFIAHRAVVTPAARDEAKQRGITINRSVEIADKETSNKETSNKEQTRRSNLPPTPNVQVTDSTDPQRATAIVTQLAKRGIDTLTAAVVLSDTPAVEVHRQTTVGDHRAVMIHSLADVDRFAAELDPTVWVLDMARTNLVAAVNIVARIAQRTGQER